MVATQIYDQVLTVLSTCGINPIMRTENDVKNALTASHSVEDHENATPLVVDMLIKNDSKTKSTAFDAILSDKEFTTFFRNFMKRRLRMDDKKCYTNTLCQYLLLVCGQFIDKVLHDDNLIERNLLDQGRQYVGSSTKHQDNPFHMIQLINEADGLFDVESYYDYELEKTEPLVNLQHASLTVFHALDTGRADANAKARRNDKDAAKLMKQWTKEPLFTGISVQGNDLSTPTSSKRKNESVSSRKSTRKRKADIMESDEESATPTGHKAKKSPATPTTPIDNKCINLVKNISSALGSLSADNIAGKEEVIADLKNQFLQLGNSVTGRKAKNCSELATELANGLAEKEVPPAKVTTPSEKTREEDKGPTDDKTPPGSTKKRKVTTKSDSSKKSKPKKDQGKKEESSNEKKKKKTPKRRKKK
jgi:hypothetical protein